MRNSAVLWPRLVEACDAYRYSAQFPYLLG